MSEETIIRQCAPTLAGLKTGSLFSCACTDASALREELRCWNRRLAGKGIRILPMRFADGRALIYVYRPAQLAHDLCDPDARSMLCERGYHPECSEACLAKLIRRLGECGRFPHEIGLFLGYPPEDVRGFVEHQAGGFKLCGCWKVYGDEGRARETFAKYKRCTAAYHSLWKRGKSVEWLAVAG